MNNSKKIFLNNKKKNNKKIVLPFYNSNFVDNVKLDDFNKEKIKSQNLDFLANYYITDKGNKYGSAHNYVQYYKKYFNKIKDKSLNILEIGIAAGSSLKMWSSYFTNSKIYGIDINSECMEIKSFMDNSFNNVELMLGDASVYDFGNLKFDIIIDDGSHLPVDMINTYNNLKKKLVKNGIYVIEDLKTCENTKYILKLKKMKEDFDNYSNDKFLKINSPVVLDIFFSRLSKKKEVNIHSHQQSSIAFIKNRK